ncbi:Short-chain dehydrogenase reductase 3b [Ranunculus cassubicifolius]
MMLNRKIAIITGGASGIGETTARLFAENGASVVIADLQDELGHQVVASIGKDKASYRHCDVRNEKEVEATVAYTLEKYGSLDILFSNAGVIGSKSGILDLDMEAFSNTMDVNVTGAAVAMKYAGRAMVEKQIHGSIICTASVSACVAGDGPHGYTASKHALVGLVRSVCGELGGYGIRVNSISPFMIATPLACSVSNQVPSAIESHLCSVSNLKGIVLKASHIAEAALFLASDESLFISGQNLVVDGGFSVVKRTF